MPVPLPLYTECPPGACVCGRDALLRAGGGDARILCLTRQEEKRLVLRLQNLAGLTDLRDMQQRLLEQLGVHLSVSPGPGEVRSARGVAITVDEQPGLCRKTRQAIAAAVRTSMGQRPQIVYSLLDEGGLLQGL